MWKKINGQEHCSGCGFGGACKCHWCTVAGLAHTPQLSKTEAEHHSIKAEEGLYIILELTGRTVAI